MNKLYRKGYYYERKVRQFLINRDYLVWRSPGSKSPIDIIAIDDKGNVRLIQVKSHKNIKKEELETLKDCLLYTSPSPRDRTRSRMPSSA